MSGLLPIVHKTILAKLPIFRFYGPMFNDLEP
jgi:hypothetical protein